MSHKIYHNPRCSKSRQTLQIMKDNSMSFEVVEYLKEIPSKEELSQLLIELNIPAENLIRKGEAAYKENFKGKDLSQEEWIDAMIAYPKLIERPIVTNGKQAIIGRPPEKVLELI
ncbi:MAG: arsenate reductase (glutaredoxin) [Salibacteraceae bacterium]